MSRTEYQIVPATQAHADELARTMRQRDVDEAWAMARLSAAEALRTSIAATPQTLAGFADGRLLCLFGIAPVNILAGTACPWMLSTDLMVQHGRGVLLRNIQILGEAKKNWRMLHNLVDVRNKVSIRWFEWLGFTVLRDHPIHVGPDQMPFYHALWERP